MAQKIKLPDSLKYWKVCSEPEMQNETEIYRVENKNLPDIKAELLYVSYSDDNYSKDNSAFLKEEAEFLKTVIDCGVSNYIEVAFKDNSNEKKAELFIIKKSLSRLSDSDYTKNFDESKVVDFGIQFSDILEKLEQNNIYHGSISPDNIFADGDRYVLGGFTDFENNSEDFTFASPEIKKGKAPDFTTDIYSLGLIMYAMCNDGAIPFESDEMNRADAIERRFTGKQISVPANGGEKLKSVIVIACQPKNKNRWKNAGNIKNALLSIKAELAEKDTTPEGNIIAPESTDFESNVFEEYDYAEPAASTDSAKDSSVNIQTATEGDFEVFEVEADSNESSIDIDEVNDDNTQTVSDNSDDEIDNRVFDNYEPISKVISLNSDISSQSAEKDYGDYFEDDINNADEKQDEPEKNDTADVYDNTDKSNELEYNVFDTESDKSNESKKGKKGLVIAIVAIIVVLAALATLGICAYNGVFGDIFNIGGITQPETPDEPNTQMASTQKPTQAPTTIPPTTAQPTTIEPTTSGEIDKFVIPVVGYGYAYAKDLLEAEGYEVEIGIYEYSHEFPEGYVIAQTPESGTIATTGTVVTLDISAGLIEEETTVQKATEAPSKATTGSNNGYSVYRGNSSYYSKSEVAAMSQQELNLALNEIYARRGRIFSDPDLASYFNSQPWYTPKYTASEFSEYVTFNDYEEQNLQLIIDEQIARGYR